MAVEILQHSMSGEYYAAQYGDGMTLDALSNIVGPLTAQEAYDALCEGDVQNGDPDDVDWAKKQPWQTVTGTDLEQRLHI